MHHCLLISANLTSHFRCASDGYHKRHIQLNPETKLLPSASKIGPLFDKISILFAVKICASVNVKVCRPIARFFLWVPIPNIGGPSETG